eukprot:7251995-Prymnesium_polylepis.1
MAVGGAAPHMTPFASSEVTLTTAPGSRRPKRQRASEASVCFPGPSPSPWTKTGVPPSVGPPLGRSDERMGAGYSWNSTPGGSPGSKLTPFGATVTRTD